MRLKTSLIQLPTKIDTKKCEVKFTNDPKLT